MKLLTDFLQALDDEDIRYVHWKNNTYIDNAVSGEDDLDLLVDPSQGKLLFSVFKKFNLFHKVLYDKHYA